MWAQRKNLVSLTLNLEDCKEPTITVEPTKVYFKGTGGPDKKAHEVTIDLFGEIDAEVFLDLDQRCTNVGRAGRTGLIIAIWLLGIQVLCTRAQYRVLPQEEGRRTLLGFVDEG